MRIAVISSHPIQYNAPLFKKLAQCQNLKLVVFYTWGRAGAFNKFDPDFNLEIQWDLPLLDGYSFEFCENVSRNPGSHHFFGIKNPKLNHQIEDWAPDIIWVWGWAFQSHLSVLRYFSGKIPIWFRGDSTLLNEYIGLKKYLRFFFLRWVYSHVDKSFYVGSNNKAYFLKCGLRENQLVYAPHAIDNDRFKIKSGQKVNSRFFKLLFVGKLEPRKNPFFLKLLMTELKDSDFLLDVVGSGPLESKLKEQFLDDSRVSFLGFKNQNDLPQIYSEADLLILPSTSETWGLAINESLASGTPVAASIYCGGAIDLINENNGFIFNPNSEITEFIAKLKEFREKTRDEFVMKFVSDFSYDSIINAILNNIEI